LERVTNDGRTFEDWVKHFQMLPNHRARWCTRLLKVQVFVAFLASLPQPAVQYVGLRADEPLREGIYSDHFESRYPLREWGYLRTS
jgi:3'-phosphoadenosine 5'-phosphosulfate sulfotransferase (PAPS reductase)/FAD synthetase